MFIDTMGRRNMHDDFPTDPVTIGILIVSLVAATIGYLGNGTGMALAFFLASAVPLFMLAWVGFFVRDYSRGSGG